RRRAQELQVAAQLDEAEPEAIHRIVQAASRLEDAATRLEDELYWFWLTSEFVPLHAPPETPQAIRALARRLEAMAAEGSYDTALHDLAVLLHATAIEASVADGAHWGPALEAWAVVWESERF